VGVVWYLLEPTANASERRDTLESDMAPLNFPCGKINGKIRLTHWDKVNIIVISLILNTLTFFVICFLHIQVIFIGFTFV
jgi:hypothetical protein